MKKTMLTMLMLSWPMIGFGAGWSYYVWNEQQGWERVSPYTLNLAHPKNRDQAESPRVMILFDQPRQRTDRAQTNWMRQVGEGLAEAVK